MNIDTGKAVISRYNEKDNIILVNIYADGQLLSKDLNQIHGAIKHMEVEVPVDTICVKSGKNYLSEEAFEFSQSHHCIHNKVIFVIQHMEDIHYPSRAGETYFKEHWIDYCTSTDEAYYLLKQSLS